MAWAARGSAPARAGGSPLGEARAATRPPSPAGSCLLCGPPPRSPVLGPQAVSFGDRARKKPTRLARGERTRRRGRGAQRAGRGAVTPLAGAAQASPVLSRVLCGAVSSSHRLPSRPAPRPGGQATAPRPRPGPRRLEGPALRAHARRPPTPQPGPVPGFLNWGKGQRREEREGPARAERPPIGCSRSALDADWPRAECTDRARSSALRGVRPATAAQPMGAARGRGCPGRSALVSRRGRAGKQIAGARGACSACYARRRREGDRGPASCPGVRMPPAACRRRVPAASAGLRPARAVLASSSRDRALSLL